SLTNLADARTSVASPPTRRSSDLLSLAGDTDANGVSVAYEVSTDGGSTWSTTSSSQSGLADGSYQFHAVVTDPAGNSSTTSPIGRAAGKKTADAGTLSFANLTDTGSSDATPITTYGTFKLRLVGDTVASGVSVAYEVSTDGGSTWSTTSSSQSGLADGSYQFHAVVTDPAGNSSTTS